MTVLYNSANLLGVFAEISRFSGFTSTDLPIKSFWTEQAINRMPEEAPEDTTSVLSPMTSFMKSKIS